MLLGCSVDTTIDFISELRKYCTEVTTLSGKCRRAEVPDYVAYTLAHIGEKSLERLIKAEEEKPSNQRNDIGIIIGEILKLGCNYAKYKVNEDLCNPIGN
jgi:hypothetical protein